MTEGIWIALIGLVAAAFGSLGLWVGRRKLKAEAAEIVTETALSLVAPLSSRVQALEIEVKQLRTENKRLESCIEDLEEQNKKLRTRVRELEEVNRSLKENQSRGGIEE